MSTYLVRLTPQEPYFFGNEKCLTFDDGNPRGQMSNRYYIKSDRTPLQTTLLGAMRYIFLPEKKYDYAKKEKYIGKESFKIEANNQSFGVIKSLSPLFLMKNGEKYIVAPFDCKPNVSAYTPFSNYKRINTVDGEKLFTQDYDPKEGISDSYMKLSDGAIVPSCEIFGKETRVGNLKTTSGKNQKGFFKKEYVYLKDNFCFAFYAELDDSAVIPEEKTQAFLGQGKSLFTVAFIEQENTLESEVKKLLPEGLSYCLSDVFTDVEVLRHSKFSVVETRDYRAFVTNPDGKITKDSVLYKLIKAGSVFIVKDREKFIELTEKPSCQLAGFNRIVTKEEQA